MMNSVKKIIVSLFFSSIILIMFCGIYFNIPVTCVNIDKSTKSKFEPNTFSLRATEGFGYGKTNNDGFFNEYDYIETMQLDNLIIGSSHMEAFQVPQEDTTYSRLCKFFGVNNTYNIGISGHDMLVCYQNLDYALNRYRPKKFVIIETADLEFPYSKLKASWETRNSKNYSSENNRKGIAKIIKENQILDFTIRKNLFFRLGFMQLNSYFSTRKSTNHIVINKGEPLKKVQLWSNILHDISKLSTKYNVKPIIMYHPHMKIGKSGFFELEVNSEQVNQFKKICEKNNIIFLDMSERFLKEYKEHYILPHGFNNSPVGRGHLNVDGHRMIAEELYKIMKGVE